MSLKSIARTSGRTDDKRIETDLMLLHLSRPNDRRRAQPLFSLSGQSDDESIGRDLFQDRPGTFAMAIHLNLAPPDPVDNDDGMTVAILAGVKLEVVLNASACGQRPMPYSYDGRVVLPVDRPKTLNPSSVLGIIR